MNKTTDILKDDIDFLEEILDKVESNNMHHRLEGYSMLRDQIHHMQKRHLSAHAVDAESRCVHPTGYIKSVRICGLCGEQM